MESKELVEIIGRIPGKKMVTISLCDKMRTYDMASDGTIGYEKGHDVMFAHMLGRALSEYGGVIVRQFIEDEQGVLEADSAVERKLPWKAIYGMFLGGNQAYALTADAVLESMTIDAKTGIRIPLEPYVRCMDISDFAPELGIFADGAMGLKDDEAAAEPAQNRAARRRGRRGRH